MGSEAAAEVDGDPAGGAQWLRVRGALSERNALWFPDTFQRGEPVLWMFPKVSGNQSSKVYTLKQEALHLDTMI